MAMRRLETSVAHLQQSVDAIREDVRQIRESSQSHFIAFEDRLAHMEDQLRSIQEENIRVLLKEHYTQDTTVNQLLGTLKTGCSTAVDALLGSIHLGYTSWHELNTAQTSGILATCRNACLVRDNRLAVLNTTTTGYWPYEVFARSLWINRLHHARRTQALGEIANRLAEPIQQSQAPSTIQWQEEQREAIAARLSQTRLRTQEVLAQLQQSRSSSQQIIQHQQREQHPKVQQRDTSQGTSQQWGERLTRENRDEQ